MVAISCNICSPFSGIKHLQDVKSELFPVASKWRSIGLALRLSDDRLDMIKVNNSDIDVTECLTDMLRLWLKKTYDYVSYGEPTWNMLRKAIASPAGGDDPALADKLPCS